MLFCFISDDSKNCLFLFVTNQSLGKIPFSSKSKSTWNTILQELVIENLNLSVCYFIISGRITRYLYKELELNNHCTNSTQKNIQNYSYDSAFFTPPVLHLVDSSGSDDSSPTFFPRLYIYQKSCNKIR